MAKYFGDLSIFDNYLFANFASVAFIYLYMVVMSAQNKTCRGTILGVIQKLRNSIFGTF